MHPVLASEQHRVTWSLIQVSYSNEWTLMKTVASPPTWGGLMSSVKMVSYPLVVKIFVVIAEVAHCSGSISALTVNLFWELKHWKHIESYIDYFTPMYVKMSTNSCLESSIWAIKAVHLLTGLPQVYFLWNLTEVLASTTVSGES